MQSTALHRYLKEASMVKKLSLLALSAVVILLSGCAVYTPAVGVVVDPPYVQGGGGGFCPPGQAKKGNC
jgi:hypothetical protein